MLCEDCKKNLANVHLTKIENHEMQKVHLCEECAKNVAPPLEMGLSNLFLTLPELLSAVLSSLEIIEDPSIKEVPERCNSCDSSFNDLRETGRFGCPECYNSFKDQIKPILTKIHGQTEHRGRTPHKQSEIVQTTVALRNLRNNLQECVKSEDYEQAAVLRDKIKEAEKAMENH